LLELQVSAGGIRGVWHRHGALTKHERLRGWKRRPPSASSSSPKSRPLLERFSPEFRGRHIEAPRTGSPVAAASAPSGTLGFLYL